VIKRLNSIKNLAIFQNFEWDQSVKDAMGAVKNFSEINILYGRNYSGKTTLSRIVRAMETGALSNKYIDPQFQVQLTDGKLITPSNLMTHGQSIRVFNEDFVRENLQFISNPEECIKPFAILGDNNNKIELEIQTLESELGKNDLGNESGLYKSKVLKEKEYQKAKTDHGNRSDQLKSQLNTKATGRQAGIKYQSARFGDQNYTVAKLENDLQTALKGDFQQQSADQIKQYEKVIEEKALSPIPLIATPKLLFEQFIQDAKNLLTKNINESNKIEELIKDAMLNKWVKEGREHHHDKRTTCAFCGNQISKSRWVALEQHFDEASRELDLAIETLLGKIELETSSIDGKLLIKNGSFYSKFHERVELINQSLAVLVKSYKEHLDNLTDLLKKKKDDKFRKDIVVDVEDNSTEILQLWLQYAELATESNSYSAQLGSDQEKAKKHLRLDEVYRFAQIIGYKEYLAEIANLKNAEERERQAVSDILAIIQLKLNKIAAKKRELNDEEKGAIKVNEYLNNHFGHQFLSLRAIKDSSEAGSIPAIRFEVTREGKKAYHLSEGECSLLAFCYFLAKLEDIDTKGSKPIIWIDDPISSLDGNHVFFIYSLISARIAQTDSYSQLFISTHNLDFLKYLKRLKGWTISSIGKPQERQKEYFTINRNGNSSSIGIMPKHLKDYVTEFNFLFHHIYKCSRADSSTDDGALVDYQFANNARKFMEIYLHYKYPDYRDESEKLIAFFGADKVPAILMDRINNEYSHLCGGFERGAMPVVVPEMKTVACQILERIKELDREQYKALLNSVGESSEEGSV